MSQTPKEFKRPVDTQNVVDFEASQILEFWIRNNVSKNRTNIKKSEKQNRKEFWRPGPGKDVPSASFTGQRRELRRARYAALITTHDPVVKCLLWRSDF